MKIYIVCCKNSGCPYPLGRAGKISSYFTKEEAQEMADMIEEHDDEYSFHRGGLFVDTLEGSESLLEHAGFVWGN